MSPSSKSASREAAEFLESMPAAYARVFTIRDVEQHAGVVARRGTQLAHAEAGHTSSGPLVVCVVADDRPGLLSLVTDALLVHGFSIDVVGGEMVAAVGHQPVEVALLPGHAVERVDVGADRDHGDQFGLGVHQQFAPGALYRPGR